MKRETIQIIETHLNKGEILLARKTLAPLLDLYIQEKKEIPQEIETLYAKILLLESQKS